MELKKDIGKLEVVSLAIGSIIGSGAFILPGDLFLKELGLYNVIIGLVIGAISILIIEKNYGYLINKFPHAGGEYIFVKNALGRRHAFICGWFLLLAYILIIPLNATALSVGINTVFPHLLEFGYMYDIAGYSIYAGEVLVAFAALVFFAFLNIKNVKTATVIQNIMVFLLVGIILFFTSTLLVSQGISNVKIASHLTFDNFEISKVLRTLIIAPFLFVGFDCIPQVAEELNFQAKKASVLAMFAIVTGAVLYMALTFSTAYGFSMAELKGSSVNWAAGESIYMYFGIAGLAAMTIAFFMAIIAGINGFYLASSRLMLAMAREGDLPEIFGRIDKKSKTPLYALGAITCISLGAPFVGRRVLLWIVNMSSLGAVTAYLYTSVSSLVIYKREHGKVSIWSLAGIMISLTFMLLMLLPNLSTSLEKESYIALIVWSILGLEFFIKIVKFDRELQRGYNQLD